MHTYIQELKQNITEENYIKNLQDFLMEFGALSTSLTDFGNGMFCLEGVIFAKLDNYQVPIQVKIEYDKKVLYKIELSLETENLEDAIDYEMELQIFYHEEIKRLLIDSVDKKKSKFTLRNYKLIYNSLPIKGFYEIDGEYKIAFHSLYEIAKDEPLTEHVICFDIELEERNFERARSLANNTITEFCNFLSVLLDIGFHEPTSKFMNFITTRQQSTQKCLSGERFRTSFYDEELELFIKDNMNGVCPKKEILKGNFINGYFSVNPENGSRLLQMKAGNPLAIEEAFRRHRLYKVKQKVNKSEEYSEEIEKHIHYLNNPINVPKQISDYFKRIDNYKKTDYEKYKYFRNACRLYNKSKIIGIDDASMEISFLVASIEALSQTETGMKFSPFVKKYNSDVTNKDLKAMYSIRSKLFHSGGFSFFEFSFDVNPYSDPIYFEFIRKYIDYKQILRTTFINWILCNILRE